jgi:lipopolysaccharide/colanic/teichoic acid biosynthesis glycosyltransferase
MMPVSDRPDGLNERAALEHKMRMKYALDRSVALLALPWVACVAALVWLAMRLEAGLDGESSGPLLYREERWTQGRTFEILKFRTTYGGTQVAGEVGRLTRVGRWLKKFYLDELPQVLNVLQGDMTLVGPRPNVPWKARREIEEEGMRGKLLLRAGLTGLVQVHKREAQDRERYRSLEDDYLNEVRHRSALGVVLYDLQLLARTVPFVLRGEGL